MSFFNDIPLAPPNSILGKYLHRSFLEFQHEYLKSPGVALECKNDQSSEKVDLVIVSNQKLLILVKFIHLHFFKGCI